MDELEGSDAVRDHAISPISLLPPELLSVIFETGQDDTSMLNRIQRLDGNGTRASVPIEITVSSVSRRWRSVALATSSLWSIVDASRGNALDMVEAYLERSNLHPLHVNFDHTGEGSEEYIQAIIFLSKLLPHLHRCVSLCIRTSEKAITAAAEAMASLELPLLRYLSISIADGNLLERTHEFTPSIFTSGAPVLSLLHLAGCRAMLSFYPPLCNVTTLHLHQSASDEGFSPMTHSHFRAVIAAAPLLQNLSLHGEIVNQWPSEGPFCIDAPDLRTLAIKFIPLPSYAFTLFRFLHAPLLHTLTLISISDSDLDPAGVSLGIHVAPFPSIRVLALDAPRLTSRTLPQFTRLMPCVTLLSFHGLVNSDMKLLLSQAKRWPELHTIELFQAETDGGQALWSTIKVRADAKRPIRVLRLADADVVSREYFAVLREKVEVEVVGRGCSGSPWWVTMRVTPWWLAPQDDWADWM